MIRKFIIPAAILAFIIAACNNDPKAPDPTRAKGNAPAAVADSLGAASKADTPYMRLEVQEFEQRVIGHKNIPIIDIRPAEEFKAGHIYRSINWPYDTTAAFYGRFETLDPKAPMALYCESGYFSNIACTKLLSKGFRKLYIIKGGMLLWLSEGKMITTN